MQFTKTLIKQTDQSFLKNKQCYNSNCLACAKINVTLPTIELANTQNLLNKGLSLVLTAPNTKPNKILNDPNMITAKVYRQ